MTDPSNPYPRHRASSMINMYGLNYCADHTNGLIYEYSLDLHSDNGDPIVKLRDTASIHGGLFGVPGKKLFFDEVEFIIAAGETDVAGTGLGAQPEIETGTVTDFTVGLNYYADFAVQKGPSISNVWVNTLENQYYGYGLDGDGSFLNGFVTDNISTADIGMDGHACVVMSGGGPSQDRRELIDNNDTYADADIFINNASTNVFWFYPVSLASDQGLISVGDEFDGGIILMLKTDGTIEASFDTDGAVVPRWTLSSVSTVNLNQWNLGVITHDPATKTFGISLNSESAVTTTYTNSLLANNVGIYLGVRKYNNTFFDAMVAGSRYQKWIHWNYAADQTFINEIYNSGAGLTTEAFMRTPSKHPAGGAYGVPNFHFDLNDDNSAYTQTTRNWAWRSQLEGDRIELMGDKFGGMNIGRRALGTTLHLDVQNGRRVARFDGATGFFDTAYGPSGAGAAFEWTVYFAGSVTTKSSQIFMKKGEFGTTAKVYLDALGRIGMECGSIVWNDPADDVGDGTFFIGAVKYSGGVGKVFINGALSNSASLSGTESGNSQLWLGCYQLGTGGDEFQGDLGETFCFNEAQEDSEIIETMNWLNNKWHVYEGWTDTPVVPPVSTDPIPTPDEPATWIDLSLLTQTTFEAMFGVPIEGADFNSSFTVSKAALVNTLDTGNRIQIQDSSDCTSAALYVCDTDGNVLDSQLYQGVPNGDSVLVPTGADYYVVVTSDTGTAKVKKWDTIQTSTTGADTWEEWFDQPLTMTSRRLYSFQKKIPTAGLAIAFTVPVITDPYTLEFTNVESPWIVTTVTGAVNTTVGDYTSGATRTWGLGGSIICGVNYSGYQNITLIPGETYIFNIRNNSPSVDSNWCEMNADVKPR